MPALRSHIRKLHSYPAPLSSPSVSYDNNPLCLWSIPIIRGIYKYFLPHLQSFPPYPPCQLNYSYQVAFSAPSSIAAYTTTPTPLVSLLLSNLITAFLVISNVAQVAHDPHKVPLDIYYTCILFVIPRLSCIIPVPFSAPGPLSPRMISN
jgi:hypothetical protein